MRTVRLLLRCIKDGFMGFAGGDPHGKSGIAGAVILIIYYLFVVFTIIQYRNGQLSANVTVYAIFAGAVIYFLILFLGALLFDFIWHILLKK